ncbi:hypothetical protein BHE74_00034302 [Ensete ventricosum]|nr:hypothetical protein BHE74_00034302 [Ensete ventricosum]
MHGTINWSRYTAQARTIGLAEIPAWAKTSGLAEYTSQARTGGLAEASPYKVSDRHKSQREGEGSKSHPSKDKEQVGPIGETQASRPRRPRSVKELYRTSVGEEDVGYYTLQMTNLSLSQPDTPLEARWPMLKQGTKIWAAGVASGEYTRGQASEAQALANHLKLELEEADQCRASLETERENYHLDLADSQKLLKELRTGRRALEDELLKLTGALEKLTVELLAETIVEYKKLTGFEMGLVRTGQVSYEYGYRVVLAKFKA